uniref:Uncharacterized protein n=1 Tax=Avena sativa TaxID=4498 RepID=A0ACD5UBA3_AVESA
MAKNKRKDVAMHNMHSYFGKKVRADVPIVSHDLNEQEPEHIEEEISVAPPTPGATIPPPIQRSSVDSTVLVVQRDPGLRCQIWDYPPNDQERARLTYMKHGPYQFHKDEYPLDDATNHPRKFQYHWFKIFPWLEYSPIKDAVYCFPCFLF